VSGLADVPTATETVGTDVLPKSAPPWKEELSVCKIRSFRVVYDREIPAILVLRGDQVLAWAGLYRRDVSDECRDVPESLQLRVATNLRLRALTSRSDCAAPRQGGFKSTPTLLR
jgi:hypothetical protein